MSNPNHSYEADKMSASQEYLFFYIDIFAAH